MSDNRTISGKIFCTYFLSKLGMALKISNRVKLFFFAILFYSQMLAQEQSPLPTPVFHTPEATLFKQFAEVPVGTFTGTPDVNVPLYNISAGGINIPITLRYKGAGIKVSEEATWVGLGWDLTVGGKIIMSPYGESTGAMDLTRGRWDDAAFRNIKSNAGIYLSPEKEYNELGDNNTFGLIEGEIEDGIEEFMPSEFCSDNCISKRRRYNLFKESLFRKFALGLLDVEGLNGGRSEWRSWLSELNKSQQAMPNIYNYSIPEANGSFVKDYLSRFTYGKEGTHILPVGRVTNPEVMIEFEGTVGSGINQSFKITDGIGNIYYFNDHSQTLYEDSQGVLHFSTLEILLTKIELLNGEEIVFNYSPKHLYYSHASRGSYTERLFWPNGILKDSGVPGTRMSPNLTDEAYIIFHEVKYLTSIETKKERVEFDLMPRSDFGVYGEAQRLSKIDIYSKPSNNLIRTIDFDNNDYFYASSTPALNSYSLHSELASGWADKRLKLNGVTINSPSIDEESEEYEFEYNETISLPVKNSYAVDHWGYYNGETDNISFYPEIPTNGIPSRYDPSLIPFFLNDDMPPELALKGTANKAPNPNFMGAWILDRINYPTGGGTSFIWEPHDFGNHTIYPANYINYDVDVLPENSFGGGMRIAAINNSSRRVNYSYLLEGSTESSGVLMQQPLYVSQSQHVSHIEVVGLPAGRKQLTESWVLHSSPGQSLLGSNIGYSRVTETIYSVVDSDHLGKTVYNHTIVPFSEVPVKTSTAQAFDSIEPVLTLSGIVQYPHPTHGTLSGREVYVGDESEPRLEEIYTPEWNYSSIFSGVNVTEYYHANLPTIDAGSFVLLYYPMNSYVENIGSKTVIIREPLEAPITTTESYTYNQFGQLSSVSSTDSDGVSVMKTEFSNLLDGMEEIDPINFSILTTDGIQGLIDSMTEPLLDAWSKSAIKLMDDKNVTNSPLETKKYVDQTLVQKSRINYYNETIADGSLIPLPKRFESLNINTGLMEVGGEVSKRDDLGNVEEIKSRAGVITSYIWGYDKTYPVAKIDNASYSLVTSHVSAIQAASDSDDDTCLEGEGCDEDALRVLFENLRNDTNLQNAFITTYTYDPLIGITSQTDPNGKTFYYEYDSFGRLMHVRDFEGNLLSKHDYHYKGQ
ncbi:MAG: RHS repeat protein [Cyclobacteriaceae bacterium]